MTTRNERKIRAGYDLFLAANPDDPADWTPDAPVAALMHPDIEWFDDVNQVGGLQGPPIRGKGDGATRPAPLDPGQKPPDIDVLTRLRQLRAEMPCCQILSLFENGSTVHTVDHALKRDDSLPPPGMRPQLCASSFEFDDETGKVKAVRYCSRELHLNSPTPQAGGSASGAPGPEQGA